MNYYIQNQTVSARKSQSNKEGNPPRKRYEVVKLAQDVHAHSVVSSVQVEGQAPKAPRKADPGEHLSRVRQWVSQARKVYSCYEAGPTGFTLHRQLEELGVENFVVVPVRLDERGRRVVTDKTDTLQLGVRLDRYVAGNKNVFSVVRVPTLAEEQRRTWTRQRKQLQGQRLSVASQGRSLALTQGWTIGNDWWRAQGWAALQKQLPAWMVEHLKIYHRLLVVIDQELKAMVEHIQTARRQRAQRQPKWAGDLSLETIEAEVCDWNRFTSWRKAGAYCGLTGGVSASGQYHQDLSITKVGNRRLRTALIEMAWRMVQHQPNYWLTKKWAHLLGPGVKAHRRQRKRAIVAYARMLFVDLWKWKTQRVSAEQLGWEMI